MKKTILFMVTNGAGLGHLTRGLAVAIKLTEITNDYQVIFLTTSLATEVIRRFGFMYFYIPSKEILPQNVTVATWNEMLRRQLNEIIDIYNPQGLVFDGAMPYIPILDMVKSRKEMKRIWIKREGDRTGYEKLSKLQKLFHATIIPAELGMEYKTIQSKNTFIVNPVILQDTSNRLSRSEMRQKFGFTKEQIVVYLQLGAGNINQIEETLDTVIHSVLELDHTHILYGESIIGENICNNQIRLTKIKEYPNSNYFNGIDLAVSAAGYNTFHELIYNRIPTLFIPNLNTTKDDQIARAKRAQQLRVGKYTTMKENIQESFYELFEQRVGFYKQIRKIKFSDGSLDAANIILNVLHG